MVYIFQNKIVMTKGYRLFNNKTVFRLSIFHTDVIQQKTTTSAHFFQTNCFFSKQQIVLTAALLT